MRSLSGQRRRLQERVASVPFWWHSIDLGHFAFDAERRGAARVAVVDHYMWSMDSPGQQAY